MAAALFIQSIVLLNLVKFRILFKTVPTRINFNLMLCLNYCHFSKNTDFQCNVAYCNPWGPLPVETRVTAPPPIFGWGANNDFGPPPPKKKFEKFMLDKLVGVCMKELKSIDTIL